MEPRTPAALMHLRDGAQAFPTWLESIAAARREILLEMYWFASDPTGWRFAEALSRRARDGLDVFVLFDSVGSLGTDRDIFAEMERSGVVLREYNPVAPWRAAFRWGRLWHRDHRKMLVVDGETAFVGGINIHDEAAPKDEGGGGWRDDCARVLGDAVDELRRLFFDNWLKRGGPAPRSGIPPMKRPRREVERAAQTQDGSLPAAHHPAYDGAFARLVPVEESTVRARVRRAEQLRASPVQVLGHPVRGAARNIRRLYLFHIRTAERAILIENAYFMPDPRVRRALERAAQRGVEVRIIVPREPDVRAVGFASQATFGPLLRAGVSIHEWTMGMMHAKTALIDDWATVGSFNLDRRSLRYNLELNVAATATPFVAEVEASIRSDLLLCEAIDPAEWARRSPWRRLVTWVYYLFRGLL